MPIDDFTGALSKYEAYRDAVVRLTMEGALSTARKYGEMEKKGCVKLPYKAARRHQAVDDWGNPLSEKFN